MKTRHWISLLLLFSISAGPSFGQLTSRALGMGLAYTAVARGAHAPDWNPANLGLPNSPSFSLSFFSIGLGVMNNAFSIDTYNEYATDEYWDKNEVDKLLDHIPDDGLRFAVLPDVRVISFSIGRFAYTMGARGGVIGTVDKTAFEIPLQGTKVGKRYTFDEMNANSLGVGFFRVSYGTPLQVGFADTFAIGGSWHYDMGFGYAHVDSNHFSLDIRPYGFDIDGKYSLTTALRGKGWGMDLGAVAKFQKNWTVSVGLFNLFGTVKWDTKVKQMAGWVRGDSVGVLDFTEEEEDEKTIEDTSWTQEKNAFRKSLPAELHLGCLYEEGEYSLTMDYVQGFKDQGWVTERPRFSFGTEWRKLHWLPLRMGVVIGGHVGFGTSFGFGLRPGKFVLDVGVMNCGFIVPSTSKGVIFSLEMGWGL